MRKLVLSLGLVSILTFSLSAQSVEERVKGTTTKNGQQILPQAGDFALGIDATPILKYAGNMFNNNNDNGAGNLFQGVDNTIYGKYFLTDNSALRVKFLFNYDNETVKSEVHDVNFPNDLTQMVENSDKESYSEFDFTLGYEWRRGYGRLQGFFGPQVGIGTYNSSVSHEYGNAISDKNPVAFRSLEDRTPTFLEFKAGGFLGVEYFIAPKISVGGEVGLNFVTQSSGKAEAKSEGWDAATSSVKVTTTKAYTDVPSKTGIYTETTGNLFVMFHF